MKSTTPRIPTEAWEKSKQLAIELSTIEKKAISAGEANRRAVELAVRNKEIMFKDAENKRRQNGK